MKRRIGIILIVGFFVLQSILTPHTGMSWDEPSSFFIGRANLKFWLTGNRQYLINIYEKSLFKNEPFQYIFGEDVYPPFPFLVASSVSYIFAEKIPLFNIEDAHHIGLVLLGVLGVGALYGLALEAGFPTLFAALVALMYGLYPTIFDTMRNDAKDIPLMSMLTVAMYCFIRFFRVFQTKGHPISWWGIAAAVMFGVAGASKPTAAIGAVIILLWIVASMIRSREFRKRLYPIAESIVAFEAFAVIALAVFVLLWPWIWDNPVGKIMMIWEFFRTVGQNMPTPMLGTIYNANVNLPRVYPFVILGVQTPIELLIFAVIGFLWATFRFIRRGDTLPFLFVVWLGVGIGRFLIPGVIIYAKVRHFIDAMPAFFILAGYGIVWMASVVHKKKIVYTLGAIVVAHLILISIQFFPYEVSYFNFLVGGAKRVADERLFDIGYTSAVKEAMAFIARDSGGKSTMVYPCLMGHLAVFYTTPSVRLTSHPELAQYTIVPNSPSWFEGALNFGDTYHQKAYTIRRMGADLFYVYKYTSPMGWRCGYETFSNYYFYERIR